jgi:hypothetical protein
MIKISHDREQTEIRQYLQPAFISEGLLYRCLCLSTPKGKGDCVRTTQKGVYELKFSTSKKEHKAEVSFELTDKEEIVMDLVECTGKMIKITLFLKGSLGGGVHWESGETKKKTKTKTK